MPRTQRQTPIAATKNESKREFKKRTARTLKHLKGAQEALQESEYIPPQEITYRLVKVIDGVEESASSFELDKTTFEYLCDFRAIIEANCCSLTTPIEEFIIGLHYHNQRALTPEQIQADLDIVKTDFADMASGTKKFISQYPALFVPGPATGLEEAA